MPKPPEMTVNPGFEEQKSSSLPRIKRLWEMLTAGG
jgi:hypothetical protein